MTDDQESLDAWTAACGKSPSTAGLGALQTMADAIAAGDGVLLNEQAKLLRQCRAALDCLLRNKPMLGTIEYQCGEMRDSIGNLRAELHKYRPQGIFNGTAPNVKISGAGTASSGLPGSAAG